MEFQPGTYIEEHDDSTREVRRRYALEPSRLYFLTLSFTEGGEFKGRYSFDVESANDSHYQFTSKEEPGIRKAVGARDGESLVDAMTRYLGTHEGKQLEAAVSFRCTRQFHY